MKPSGRRPPHAVPPVHDGLYMQARCPSDARYIGTHKMALCKLTKPVHRAEEKLPKEKLPKEKWVALIQHILQSPGDFDYPYAKGNLVLSLTEALRMLLITNVRSDKPNDYDGIEHDKHQPSGLASPAEAQPAGSSVAVGSPPPQPPGPQPPAPQPTT